MKTAKAVLESSMHGRWISQVGEGCLVDASQTLQKGRVEQRDLMSPYANRAPYRIMDDLIVANGHWLWRKI